MKTPMTLTTSLLISAATLSTAVSRPFQCTHTTPLPPADVDIAILGGGASGTYAAIQLQRQNQSFALIEAQDKLGGQVNTYQDLSMGETVEYGVNQYTDVDGAAEFLNYLGVPYTRQGTEGGGTGYIDIAAGKMLEGPDPEEKNATAQALQTYTERLSRYPKLENGFLLEPVPEDLLLPFTDFATRYGIERAVKSLSTGMGDLTSLPTLYVMKHYGSHVFQNRFLYTARKNNQEIYDKAQKVLGSNVFLSSKSLAIQRDDDNVQLCLRTPAGTHLLHAKRLLLTIPPTLNTIKNTGLDLSTEETALFANFSQIGYYSCLVRIPGFLPFQQNDSNNVTFLENEDASDEVYGLAKLPAIWNIHKTGIPDLYQIEYGAPSPLPEDVVTQNISSDLTRLRAEGLIAITDKEEEPEMVRFANHSPFYPYASADAIRDGFYKKLYELQGERNTFWTGSAFHVPDSALLWRFTEGVIGELVKGLG